MIQADQYVAAATQHGDDSDPDHTVGDLQDFFRAAHSLLTPAQRRIFDARVRVTYFAALGLDEDAAKNTPETSEPATHLLEPFTVVGFDEGSGGLFCDRVLGLSEMDAFAVSATNRASDAVFVAALSGHLSEEAGLFFPGESLVYASTVREQSEVFDGVGRPAIASRFAPGLPDFACVDNRPGRDGVRPVVCSSADTIVVFRGHSGYFDAAVVDADSFNAQLGITPAQREAMFAGSMFGWGGKASDPANYDENGEFRREVLSHGA